MVDWLERHQLLVLVAVVAVFGLGLGVHQVTRHSPPPIEFRTDPSLVTGAPIRVHVAGAVVKPGVYTMKAGDRVADAVAAAGGPADSGDLDGVNLARKLRDEEQLVVPLFASPRASTRSLPGAPVDI